MTGCCTRRFIARQRSRLLLPAPNRIDMRCLLVPAKIAQNRVPHAENSPYNYDQPGHFRGFIPPEVNALFKDP